MHYVYILKNLEGKFYIGSTANLEKRLVKHNNGGSKWTKNHRPWQIVHSETFLTKTDALKREKEIKSYKGGILFKKLVM